MPDIPAYILAGGHSKRFGSDKARAKLDGTPLIVRLANALQPSTPHLFAVADQPDKYADLNIPTIVDLTLDLGPMGGLQTALQHRINHYGQGWLLLCSCDLIHWHNQWLTQLSAAITPNNTPPATQAVVFRDDRWYPMPGLYHSSILQTLNDLLDQYKSAMWQLLESVNTIALPMQNIPPIRQANRPEDIGDNMGDGSRAE